jgi:peptidyl-prolyl cis-trans isomerase D
MQDIGKKLNQIALGALVILLAGVFALQFGGPQAQGCGSGGSTYAARVYGDTLTEGDFRANYVLAGFDRYPTEVAQQQNFRELVLDGLIERELLARAAEEVGFRATEDEVMRKLARDGSVWLSLSVDAPPNMPNGEIMIPVRDRDDNFDLDSAKRFIQFGLRRSVTEFGEAQVRETLAQRMRDMILSTVTVSSEEVWATFRRERDTANLEYVRFTPSYFGESLTPTPEDIDAWIAENDETVDREYQANRHRYTGLEKQVRARHILISVDSGAADDVKAAAEARATALLGRVRAGEDFETLARDNSDDTSSAVRGGDLGYNPRGRMVAEFDEAQFSMEVGDVSDLVETQFGYHIIEVTAVREGDVPEDEAKRELADRLYREARATELAEAAADEALSKVRGGMSMQDLDAELAGASGATTPGETGEEGEEAETEERDPRAPQLLETSPFGRADSPITGISDNGPIVRAAFELTAEDRIPSTVIEAGGEHFVIRLSERNVVRREDMEPEVAERMRDGLIAAKQREVLELYVRQLRSDAEAEGAIQVNNEILSYEREEDM